ncbi:mycothiol synthase [Saccharothrix longispora]|uniref:Mycothiol acetyltransferase n=1 Tax=Saccharothrix longispora TaxID=33920 RepID=A0ABU1Q335_9PSEU|nr:mycothiol synthase [Saccharothrix longispora]MDR6597081.1 mycothiol synthase [Saccharothrix longispora]
MESSWFEELSPAQADEVTGLLRAAQDADGVAPVGEAVVLRLRPGARGSAHLLARVDGALVGYLHLDVFGDADGNKVAELAVHPAHRRRGHGAALLAAVAERAEPLRVWAHGGRPDQEALAAKLGYRKVRELLRLRRPLDADLPSPVLPEGVRLRSFVPGRDEAAVVYVNHRAFAWHPEQGAMSIEDVRDKEGEPWFDATGFLLAVDAEERLLGFHWTKVHSATLGEVYVVGVDPDAQGGGLGKALTLAGLAHLRAAGLAEVMLYVESDNAAALAVYNRLGFTRWDSDAQYAR